MSPMIRSTRSKLRRKIVLPVTIVRGEGRGTQLAHTLDLTEVSARLGGLGSLLEPGEIIEVQRGAVKAKFQVFWMGAARSAMEGQAGVRSIEPDKNIWGIDLPVDETEAAASPGVQRKASFLTRIDGRPSTEKRWHTRVECIGGASVQAEGSGYPVRGQVKDIAHGGAYVDTITPLTVNTKVYIKMIVEDVAIESAGVVRTSYPMVGMGVSFQNISPENQLRIDNVIQTIRNRSAPPNPNSGPVGLQLAAYPVLVLATAFRTLAAGFDTWKIAHSLAELDEFRLALAELQQKLEPSPQMELVDFFSTPTSRGEHA